MVQENMIFSINKHRQAYLSTSMDILFVSDLYVMSHDGIGCKRGEQDEAIL